MATKHDQYYSAPKSPPPGSLGAAPANGQPKPGNVNDTMKGDRNGHADSPGNIRTTGSSQ